MWRSYVHQHRDNERIGGGGRRQACSDGYLKTMWAGWRLEGKKKKEISLSDSRPVDRIPREA